MIKTTAHVFAFLLLSLNVTNCNQNDAETSKISSESSSEVDYSSKADSAVEDEIAAENVEGTSDVPGDQEVSIQNFPPEAFELKSNTTGKCVDVAGNGRGNGNRVIIWNCNGQANQIWEHAAGGGPRWTYRSRSSGKCLDFVGGPGGPIVIWDCHGRGNQNLEPQYGSQGLNGSFRVQANAGYNACLDVNRRGELVHNHCHGGPGMQFHKKRR